MTVREFICWVLEGGSTFGVNLDSVICVWDMGKGGIVDAGVDLESSGSSNVVFAPDDEIDRGDE